MRFNEFHPQRPFETMWNWVRSIVANPSVTINLSMYTILIPATLDGSYEKGDAHILDQVKITVEVQSWPVQHQQRQ